MTFFDNFFNKKMLNIIVLIVYITGILALWVLCFKAGVWIGDHVEFCDVHSKQSPIVSTTNSTPQPGLNSSIFE